MDLPPGVKAQRAVENRAIKLGKERNKLEARLAEITEEAVELMAEAERSGVPIGRLAELIQIERSTLYRWRDATAILRADQTEQTRGK